ECVQCLSPAEPGAAANARSEAECVQCLSPAEPGGSRERKKQKTTHKMN
ncbi:hypothetical protein SAMN04488579_13415, partial [Eubacterium barkeri]